MKNTVLIFLLLLSYSKIDSHNLPDNGIFQNIKSEIIRISDVINTERNLKLIPLYASVNALNLELEKGQKSPYNQCNLLIEKDRIKSRIVLIEQLADLELTQLRFKKGIEIIKIIYEKILDLDHHYTSLQTLQNISDLTNPNKYPEFAKKKEAITERLSTNKKTFTIPALLETNPFVSLTMSLVSTLIGEGKKEEKEADLQKISCILDFTVKMHSDLKIIFYETEFLKSSNLQLKESAVELFKEYNGPIGYLTSIIDCRANDDWDQLNDKLDSTIKTLKENLETEDAYVRKKALTKINNFEFSIDRLSTFINRYIDFIIEGEQYYTKFNLIINNYNNEAKCTDQLPHQFDVLKRDVNTSLKKFSEAYNITELKGSKLRDLLYGLPQ